MAELSGNLLFFAFIFYLAATVAFAGPAIGRKWSKNKEETNEDKWGSFGYILSIIAMLFSMGYFATRWIASGHAPVSNMFEYMTALGIAIGIAFVIIFAIYRFNMVGLFTMPVVMIIIAYASMFPHEIAPLIPALQSKWLTIHVMTTVIAQGVLSIGFGAGLVYLIRTIDFTKSNKQTKALELVMYSLVSLLSFIIIGSVFNGMNYEANFSYVNEKGIEATMEYNLPAIIGPNEGQLLTEGRFSPLIDAPAILMANDLNTVLWSLLTGLILYWLLRLVLRKRIGAAIQPILKGVSPQAVDEISYRAIAIGFPLFTLGALIFAMIWAQQAWTRFWGWDPKEVWALITFLFYAAYLHLRLSKGWHGNRSAWLCVIGFVIIMFNLVFVNLVIAGLHSYA